MISLSGLNYTDLEEQLCFLPRFRIKQIYNWILKSVSSFNEMKNLPSSLQNELNEKFRLFSSSVTDCQEEENTKKYVISLKDGVKIEAVLLSDSKKRLTACISTQAGCPCGCVFCKTGSIGFKRNLESYEITEQFLHLRKNAAIKDSGHIIDNIVIMGMGEPLLNLDNLRKAIAVFTDPDGLKLSKRRITVSTCGINEPLFDLAKNGPFIRLALSLTTADEDLRHKLMPVTKSNSLKDIKKSLLVYQKNNGGRITFEIPLLGNINTREKDANCIAEFSKGLDVIINLIPWNPVDNLEFEGKILCQPGKEETKLFMGMLENYKLKVTMRLHKGRSVLGACGQLGSI